MRTILRNTTADRRANATCRACHKHDLARKFPFWWCLFELVLLQRPVFNGIALGITQRDETTTCLGPTHDCESTMVQLCGDINHRHVFSCREHAYTWNQNHAWMRVSSGIRFAIDRSSRIGVKILFCIVLLIAMIFLYVC